MEVCVGSSGFVVFKRQYGCAVGGTPCNEAKIDSICVPGSVLPQEKDALESAAVVRL